MFVERYAQSFMKTQGRDTEIRPGVNNRKGLGKMMPELHLKIQVGGTGCVQNLFDVGVFSHSF